MSSNWTTDISQQRQTINTIVSRLENFKKSNQTLFYISASEPDSDDLLTLWQQNKTLNQTNSGVIVWFDGTKNRAMYSAEIVNNGNLVFEQIGNATNVQTKMVLIGFTRATATVAELTIASIPATYTHLLFLVGTRSTQAAVSTSALLRINNISASNSYVSAHHGIRVVAGSPTSVTGQNLDTAIRPGFSSPGASADKDAWLFYYGFIPNYRSTTSGDKQLALLGGAYRSYSSPNDTEMIQAFGSTIATTAVSELDILDGVAGDLIRANSWAAVFAI